MMAIRKKTSELYHLLPSAIPYFFVSIVFLLSRVLFIDADLPPWGVAQYQSIDEFYYTVAGFNLFHYGKFDYAAFDFLLNSSYLLSWLQEYMTYLALELFGNNYYGLRIPSIVSGFGVFSATIFSLYYYQKKYIVKQNNDLEVKYFLVFVALYMIVDFSFILSNRIAEPTIFRMLAMMALFVFVLILTSNGLNRRNSFFIGFMTFSAFIYAYTTNFFLLPGMFLSVSLMSFRSGFRDCIFNLAMFTLGLVLSLVLWLVIYNFVTGANYFSELMLFFSSKVGDRVGLGFYTNLRMMTEANIFRFNISFFLMAVFSLPYYFYILLVRKNNIDILLGSLTVLFFLQTLFINDYPHRKLVFLFPLLVMIVSIVCLHRNHLRDVLNRNIYYKYFSVFYLFGVFLLCWYLIDDSLKELEYLSKAALCVTLMVLFLLFFSTKGTKSYYVVIYFIIFSSSSLYMDYKYIYSSPTYKYKNSMVELATLVGDEYVYGMSHSMRLYNDIKPVMNAYLYWHAPDKNVIKEHSDRLFNEYRVRYHISLSKSVDESSDYFVKKFDINEVTGLGRSVYLLKRD